jgi:hypothetical protein
MEETMTSDGYAGIISLEGMRWGRDGTGDRAVIFVVGRLRLMLAYYLYWDMEKERGEGRGERGREGRTSQDEPDQGSAQRNSQLVVEAVWSVTGSRRWLGLSAKTARIYAVHGGGKRGVVEWKWGEQGSSLAREQAANAENSGNLIHGRANGETDID